MARRQPGFEMVNFIAGLLAIAAGVAAATMLSLALMRRRRPSRRSSGLVVASAMFLGIGHVFGGVQEDMLQASKDETNRKKPSKPGDPPNPLEPSSDSPL
jgi:hypothetical protein